MKRFMIAFVGCILLLSCFSYGDLQATFEWKEPEVKQVSQVIDISRVSNDMLLDFIEGRLPNVVIECPSNFQLPLTLSLEGEFFSLDGGDQKVMLNTHKQFYIIMPEKEKILFSTDLQNWKNFEEFSTGMISFTFNVNENHLPEASLKAILNER